MYIYVIIWNIIRDVYKFEKSMNMSFQYSYIVGIYVLLLTWVNRWMDYSMDEKFENIGLKVYFTYSLYTWWFILWYVYFSYCTKVYGILSGFVADGSVLEDCDCGEVIMLLYVS
jgi:hypothetical protein